MRSLVLSACLLLSLAAPAFAQFPDQRFPDQGFSDRRFQQDPFMAMERQQIAQETLLILRDTLSLMRGSEGMEPSDLRRIEDLSARLDMLISRQQELAMRERLGR